MRTVLPAIWSAARCLLLVTLVVVGGALNASSAAHASPPHRPWLDPNARTHPLPHGFTLPPMLKLTSARVRYEAWMPASYNPTSLVATGLGGTVTVRYFLASATSNAAYYHGGTRGPDVTVSGPSILKKSMIPRADADRVGVKTPVQNGITYRYGDTMSNKWWPGCRLWIDGKKVDEQQPRTVPEMRSTDYGQCYGYLK